MPNINHLLAQAQQLLSRGQFAAAEPCFRQVLSFQPRNADALAGLGIICNYTQRTVEAIELFQKAVALKPYHLVAHANLGAALFATKRYPAAIASFRQFLLLQPSQPLVLFNLGAALAASGENEEAIATLRQAIALKPDYPEAQCALGNTLKGMRRYDEAAAVFRAVLARAPHHADAARGLADVLREIAQPEEAVALFRDYLQQKPEDAEVRSTMLLTLQFVSEAAPGAHLRDAIHWAKQYAQAAAPAGYANDPSPDRRLRVGYVSPDLRHSSVAYFLENLLAFHRADQVEVFCYSDVAAPDVVTRRLMTHAHQWRDTAPLSATQLAERIREDRIDILIDLAGHTAGNRLLTFAAAPAPVQISYLGYIATTGIPQIQYRLADAYTDPPGRTEQFQTERLLRLSATLACYRPPDFAPLVAPLPARANGYVTFGCLNATAKINTGLLRVWTDILARVPAAHLLFAGAAYATPSVQERLLQAFAAAGIDPARIAFVGLLSFMDYLHLHDRIDILLDQLPLNNHTVTCQGLWMGVPTVSQAGDRYAARLGASVLHNLGLGELVAESAEQYVSIAGGLAEDVSRLEALRAGMRERMKHSPLMDYPAFAADVEAAYRACWKQWCAVAASPAMGMS